MQSWTNIGSHTPSGSLSYETRVVDCLAPHDGLVNGKSSMQPVETLKADSDFIPSSTFGLNTADDSFPIAHTGYQMTGPSIQLFLPHRTMAYPTHYDPVAQSNTFRSTSTSPGNSLGSTQCFAFASSSSSRSGVPTWHDQQLLKTGYYVTSQYPESSSWDTFAPCQGHEASEADIYDGGSVAGGATAREPSSIRGASFMLPSHHGATHWGNPGQPSRELKWSSSIAASSQANTPTRTETELHPGFSANYRAASLEVAWNANQATNFDLGAAVTTRVEENDQTRNFSISSFNTDLNFNLSQQEGGMLYC
ncbi:hypothetical protein NLJ89_g4840 [Agrocybe chaxingu]|uniref:Uncharacterized protein n=1 Tax=Agrocybe chaxingu TaxID=84603 RepID=A0A9W8MVK3_9AGAR|nr:hypothetical protein NLJ89_g4840 [Agrocybe chaxingu]